jgi:hypothetical protein
VQHNRHNSNSMSCIVLQWLRLSHLSQFKPSFKTNLCHLSLSIPPHLSKRATVRPRAQWEAMSFGRDHDNTLAK